MEPLEIAPGIYDVGVTDWNIRDFHGYSTDLGTTYNSFLIVDEKIALLDTVKKAFADQLLDNISAIVDPKNIDYVISNHTELDHSGGLARVMHRVGEDKPFPHIEGLGAEAKSGAYFTVLFPSTQFVFAQDCAWWLAFQPQAVDRTKLTLGACFPSDTVALDDFKEKVQLYFNRWKLATAEDNNICELQQRGQAFDREPGRFAASEFAVHRFSNWIAEQLS